MTQRFAPFDVKTIALSGKNLIEASAGTGKTHAISTLFGRLVVERGFEPKQILVVTFTEAATSELRERVRADLVKAAALGGNGPDTPRARVRRALEGIDEAPISTIHAFCQRALLDYALQSGVRFDSELVPDLEELYDDVVYDFWNGRVAHGPPGSAEALRAAKLAPDRLRRILAELRKNPDLELVPSPSTPELALQHDFVAYARAELERRKDERGVLGFEDLLVRLHAALGRPAGESLVRALRERFRAVLIDEFQDTDPTQGRIFERAFGGGGHPLFLIGDPKQAIYGFRGADVRSYLGAAEGAARFTMGRNWRSDPAVIAAVNRVFDRRGVFVVDGIEYAPVEPQPEARNDLSVPRELGPSALDLLFVKRDDERKPIGKPKARAGAARLTAADIVELLRSDARVRGERVTELDIAVLTRTNNQAFDVQEALRERGVHSVVIGDKSVFDSDEARDLEFVLGAVLEPGRTDLVKRALTSGLLGQKAEEILKFADDTEAYEAWLTRFRGWNARWVNVGFMSMFRELLAGARAAEHLLGRPGGERRLTNVLHLAELLHQASTEEHLGPAALVSWLGEQLGDVPTRAEHTEIRLESDERAVRIMTVHKAKGLEFPIVYCPYLWDGVTRVNVPFSFYERNAKFLEVDPDPKRREPHKNLAARDAFAEELRVVYVALTRAKHRTTVLWGAFNQAGASAGAYLLVPPAQNELETIPPKQGRLDKCSDDELVKRLGALGHPGSIGLRSITWDFDTTPLERADSEQKTFSALGVERPIRAWQRIDSFSALTKHVAHAASDDDEVVRDRDDDAVAKPDTPKPNAALASRSVSSGTTRETADRKRIELDGFPRGRLTGDFFHSILEDIEFDAAGEALLEVAQEKLEVFGLARGLEQRTADGLLAKVVSSLRDLLDTPIDAARGVRLRDVAKPRRVSELEFHLPVVAGRSGDWLDRKALSSVFREHASPEVPTDYAERVERLGFAPLSGFLKGFIDLVFVHEGRWYVVDYKTNHLSDFVDEYDTERMTAAMAESHYFLQYHLYALALCRLVARHERGFDYEKNFGGALYLFLKGMRPGSSTGIFFEKPPLARMQALSRAFGAEGW